MDRREFISNTCLACASGGAFSALLTSCQSTHYVTGALESSGISVPISEFEYYKKEKKLTREMIVVHHDKLEFPISIYRISDTEYSALWMKCSHQGSELNAAGDHLYCSSHGSEFDRKGNVTHGPAEKNLRSFPTSVQNQKVVIDLTKA